MENFSVDMSPFWWEHWEEHWLVTLSHWRVSQQAQGLSCSMKEGQAVGHLLTPAPQGSSLGSSPIPGFVMNPIKSLPAEGLAMNAGTHFLFKTPLLLQQHFQSNFPQQRWIMSLTNTFRVDGEEQSHILISFPSYLVLGSFLSVL